MIKYTTYDFYKDTYLGDMPKSDFEKLVIRASNEVCNAIMNKNITKHEEEVQLATCSVADVLLKIEQLEQNKSKLSSSAKEDKVVASESVADLSKTYANTTKLADLDLEISNQKAKITEEISLYLLNTGLLYRGV